MTRRSGRVLRASFHDLASTWLELESAALDDEPDAVHQMRVTSRRLRALLRLWGRALRVDAVGLAHDLRWVARALGDVRDLDVLEDRLLGDAEASDSPEAAELIRSRLDDNRARARAALADDVASVRFTSVRIGVQGLLDAPVRRSWRHEPADRLVRAARRRCRAAVRAFDKAAPAGGEEASPEQLERLHHARRVAKSARYASEALAAQGVRRRKGSRRGSGPEQWGEAFTAVADALGVVQDTVVAERHLRGVAVEVGSPTAEAFAAMADREAAQRPDALAESVAAMATARRLVR